MRKSARLCMVTLLAAWTAALPVVNAAPIPIETKGIPDDSGRRRRLPATGSAETFGGEAS